MLKRDLEQLLCVVIREEPLEVVQRSTHLNGIKLCLVDVPLSALEHEQQSLPHLHQLKVFRDEFIANDLFGDSH